MKTGGNIIVSVNGATNPSNITSNQFVLKLNNGKTWVVFTSAPVNMGWNKNMLQAASPFDGWVRLAHVFDGSSEMLAVLVQYKDTIPVSGTVDYGMTGTSSSEMVFTWQVEGTPENLLMMALPHHMDILQSPKQANINIYTSKGTMVGILSRTISLRSRGMLLMVSWIASKKIQFIKIWWTYNIMTLVLFLGTTVPFIGTTKEFGNWLDWLLSLKNLEPMISLQPCAIRSRLVWNLC